ncbi:MAG: aspartyl protease family protein [Planctomycetota bacterium]|nr:aspartyl protease family protein [Planctomycetota bacterium]
MNTKKNRLFLVGGFLTLAFGAGVPQVFAQHDAEDLQASIPEETTLATETVRIPFELKANKIYIETMINGKGPFPFIFDTGASVTVIDQSLTEELGLEKIGKSEIGDPSGSQQISVDLVRINALQAGGLMAKGFEASSWDRGDLYQRMQTPPKGIIGFPVFHEFLLTIDYEASELVVTRGSLSPADDHVIAYTAPMGIAEMECTVNGRSVTTHLDTGGPHGVMVPESVLEKGDLEGDPIVVGRARTVNSEFEIKAAHLNGSIEIAGHRVEDPVIMLNSLYDAVNFGYGFLKHFRVTFDQASELVRFEPLSDQPIQLKMPQMRHGGPQRRH